MSLHSAVAFEPSSAPSVFSALVDAIPAATNTPLGLIGLLGVTGAATFLFWTQAKFKAEAKALLAVPEEDRREFVTRIHGPFPKSFSAQAWLMSQRQRYLLLAFVCTLATLLLGFIVMVVFSAIQSAGNLVDLFGGFQLAQAFDPQMMINGAQFTRLFQMTALVLLFVSSGYQLIIGGLTRSFTAIPLGGGLALAAPMKILTDAVGGMLLSALQIAGPLIVVLFLADAGLGLLTRVAPALNAFALGFPLKILITLTLASTVFVSMPHIVEAVTGDSLQALMGVR